MSEEGLLLHSAVLRYVLRAMHVYTCMYVCDHRNSKTLHYERGGPVAAFSSVMVRCAAWYVCMYVCINHDLKTSTLYIMSEEGLLLLLAVLWYAVLICMYICMYVLTMI